MAANRLEPFAQLTRLTVSEAAPHVLHVELQRPQKLNALDMVFWEEIRTCFEAIALDVDTRVVLLSGAGRCFCAGLDLGAAMAMFGGSSGTGQADSDVARKALRVRAMGKAWQASFTSLEACGKAVIGCVHGAVVGAGLENPRMITACDVRFCTEDAYFQAAEVDVGLAADVGGLQRLPKIIGNQILVRELALSGRRMAAPEALQHGLVSHICATKETMLAQGLELAKTIAAKSPVATLGVKQFLNYARDHSVEDSLDYAITWNMSMLQGSDMALAAASMLQTLHSTSGKRRMLYIFRLQSDSAQKLLPQDPDRKDSFQGAKLSLSPRPGGKTAAPAVGTGFRRRPSMVARRFPDFDIYLTESLIPVLVQAMDALCRQVAYMEKQDKKLDARVRARFNPLTWLAQQLLRRHPRVATTPRRMTLYRNFRDWADQEQHSRSKVMEVFNGFLQKGVCGKNSLPFVLAAVDEFFCLRGALKDNANVQHAVLEGKTNVGGRRGSRLGGEGITFDQFWFKLANAIVKHDVVTFSMIMHGRELKKIKEQEQQQLMEAARLESERREQEQAELNKLKQAYEKLYPKLVENEALKAILDGKVLSGTFLKPTDPAFELEVAPHGRHVQLLADLMALLGLEIATVNDGAAGLEAELR
eukprot:s1828_g3.t1